MNGWRISKLGKEFDLMTGGTPSKSNVAFFKGGNIPWLVSGDINKVEIDQCDNFITELGMANSNARYLPLNSVMIALNGQGKTKGSVAMLRIKATCNQSLVSIYPKDWKKQYPEYLFYFLGSKYQDIRKLAGGNDRRGLNMGLIRSIEVPFPSINEQKRIVSKLDSLFKRIDQSISLLEENLKHTQALMSSVLDEEFGRFKEVSNELRLGDIVINLDGKRKPIKASVRKNISGNIPYYGASGIIDHVNDFLFEGENLLISEDGANLVVRKYPIAFIAKGRYWVNNHAHVVSAKKEITSNEYLEIYFANLDISSFVTGAAQPKLSQKKMNEIRIQVPSLQIQQTVIHRIRALRKGLDSLELELNKKINNLKALKSSLLDKAFKGEL